MTTFAPCPACRRHVATAERGCPFCGAIESRTSSRIAVPSRWSRAAIFASTVLAGCYTSSPPPTAPPHDQQRRHVAEPPATGTATITGTIRDTNNKNPVANVPLQLQSASQPSMPLRYATTDANGKYSFTDVPAGAYYLFWDRAYPGGGRPQRTVEVASGDVKQLDLQLYPPPQTNVPMPYGAPPARRRTV